MVINDDRNIRALGDTEAHLLLTLASQGRHVFTTTAAHTILGGARHLTNKMLARLNQKRWVLRLQRGLYLLLPLEAGIEGKYSIHPFRIAPYLAEPHAIAYWSALHHYGYTEQIPSTTFVATTTRRASTTLEIEELGLTYRFVVLAEDKFFGLRSIWIEGQEVAMTDPAKTVIDCLDHPEYCGGIIEAAKGLHSALTEGDISANQLTDYADRMENRTIFKRMGYLAELLALSVEEELERWHRDLSAGYGLLDPLAGDDGPYNSRWQLRLNRPPADLTDWMVY
jgi:predicted transcriptional regulator of viral defense system